MYIIVAKSNNQVIGIGSKIYYHENHYPSLDDSPISYPADLINVYQIDNMPEHVIPYEWKFENKIFTPFVMDGVDVENTNEEENPHPPAGDPGKETLMKKSDIVEIVKAENVGKFLK